MAGKLAPKIPGASREVLRPGAIPSWIIPDDAPEYVTDAMLAVARAEAGEMPAVPGAPARVASSGSTPAVARLREEFEREQAAFELERLRDEKGEWAVRRQEVDQKRQAAREAQRREAAERAAAERRAQVEAEHRRRREAADAEERRRREAAAAEADRKRDRKSTRLNSSHIQKSRMPSSA